MHMENLIEEVIQLQQQIRSKEPPPCNEKEEHAAIVMVGVDQDIQGLILDGMPIKTIVVSLFYFW